MCSRQCFPPKILEDYYQDVTQFAHIYIYSPFFIWYISLCIESARIILNVGGQRTWMPTHTHKHTHTRQVLTTIGSCNAIAINRTAKAEIRVSERRIRCANIALCSLCIHINGVHTSRAKSDDSCRWPLKYTNTRTRTR